MLAQIKMKQQVPHVPGPGAYGRDEEDSLFAKVTKRVAARGGGFGSSGHRFQASSQQPRSEAGLPGPGSYDSAPLKPKSGSGYQSSTFASSTVRMKPARGAAEPKYSEFESDKEVLGVLF
jgi:hypothetical protein